MCSSTATGGKRKGIVAPCNYEDSISSTPFPLLCRKTPANFPLFSPPLFPFLWLSREAGEGEGSGPLMSLLSVALQNYHTVVKRWGILK